MIPDPVPTPEEQEPGVSAILETSTSSPMQRFVRIGLTLVILYLIFGVMIPSFASYAEIWDAITALTATELIVMALLTLVIEACSSGAFAMIVVPLRLWDAFLAQENSTLVSNTVPGPSGTAARYVSFKKFGISNEDFAQSYVVNNAWSNGLRLVLPAIGVLLLATQKNVPTPVWILAGIGLAVSTTLIFLAVRVMRSESFAYRLGERLGRFLNWARGVVRRPSGEPLGATFVKWRFDVLETVQRVWARLTGLILLRELVSFVALLLSLRYLGVGPSILTAIEIFAVYTVVRLATWVKITPGNVGITEAMYIGALTWAADDRSTDAIVAAVFVFRMFTYLGPIILGGIATMILSRRFGSTPADVPAS